MYVVSESRKYQTINEIIRGFANSVKFFFSMISMEFPEYATYHTYYSIFELFHIWTRVYDELSLVNAQCCFCFKFHLLLLHVSLFERHVFAILLLFFLFASFLKTNTIDIFCFALKINGYLVRDSTFGSIAINLALALAYIYIYVFACNSECTYARALSFEFSYLCCAQTRILLVSCSIYTLRTHVYKCMVCINTKKIAVVYRRSSNAINETERIESLVMGASLLKPNRYSLVPLALL